MAALVDDLGRALPGSKLHVDRAVIHGTVPLDDDWFTFRARLDPFAEVFVGCNPTDGFELAIRWGDRRGDPELGDPAFDAAFGIVTNDEPLARIWLDPPARAALADSAYERVLPAYLGDRPFSAEPAVSRRTWTYELGHDEVAATKGTSEGSGAQLAVVIRTACTLAGRSRRWAAEYAVLARSLDAVAGAEVAVGGGPVITASRSAVDLAVRVLRSHQGHARLRTMISAPRIGYGGDSMSVVDEALPRAARLRVPAVRRAACPIAGYELRRSTPHPLDGLSQRLITAVRPAALIVEPTTIELWFDGVPMEHARFDAGLELVAKLALDGIATRGPYR